MTEHATTWDGKPISPEKPTGAVVVVYRESSGRTEFLLLHRAHSGPDHEGDWAWTPPSGARFPGEPIEECAQRELLEEIGASLPLRPMPAEDAAWAIFTAEAPPDLEVVLDEEHDRFEWVSIQTATRMCLPAVVANEIRAAAEYLGLET